MAQAAGRTGWAARRTGLPLLHHRCLGPRLTWLYLPLGASHRALDPGLKHPGQPAAHSRSDRMSSEARGISDQCLGKWPSASQPQHQKQLELQMPSHGWVQDSPACTPHRLSQQLWGAPAGEGVCRGGFRTSLISSSPQNNPMDRRYAPLLEIRKTGSAEIS